MVTKSRKRLLMGAPDALRPMLANINQLLDQVHAARKESIKETLQRNWRTLESQISNVMLVISGRDLLRTKDSTNPMLSSRIKHPLCMLTGFPGGLGKKDMDCHESPHVSSIKVPFLRKLPRHVYWVHFTRNEKMPEHESVIGKRQIYYDQHGWETLICSDSDEELLEPEEREFTEAEDRVMRMAFEECGLTDEILSIVKIFVVEATDEEIQERYKALKEMDMRSLEQNSEDSGGNESPVGACLKKRMSDALDSFDNLLCRQCIQVFDCPLHGCSQPLIYPSEKQPAWSVREGDRNPCSDQCYLRSKDVNILPENSVHESFQDKNIKAMEEEEEEILTASGARELDLNLEVPVSESMRKRKVADLSDSALGDSILPPDESQDSRKTTKGISDDIVSSSSFHGERENGVRDGHESLANAQLPKSTEDKKPSVSDWKLLERELYLKGVEMFGKNSCLIARNLLFGLKTCMEVAMYMYADEVWHKSISRDKIDGINGDCMGQKKPSKLRLLRKKGKTRRFRYSRKTAGLPSTMRRFATQKCKLNKHYTPCGCQGMCGKQCPCLLNGTCCEKFCGCSKACKNRFRGCHCVKSQCKSRLCPCFAANRECDPDVCRNCWVSCGDGSLGEPPRRGVCQCGNMMLLFGRKHRILLARSDVAGWGAFSKNPVTKNDCLGEYTGELITHKEAEKRGKIYDRSNFSFLFNLNDQFVLDAYRKGDKLKFANHSSKPNCYAKVMLVGGDHRVGIYAKEDIGAGEELFYDYGYAPERTPSWARIRICQGNMQDDESSDSEMSD
ncbi:hypothetical protein RJT34_19325 [Clitoria ternatea]|uniref:Uncharacterized protein n=1 Tax=Clitoria ternatea TaxID=43366 RepID=A0AAN9IQT5_CLITE